MALEVITLTEPFAGATAQVAPGFGFNCFAWRPVVAGTPLDALWATSDFTSGAAKPSHSGIPILFPFPGRIRKAAYEYAGRLYTLESAGMNQDNAIHGYVLSRAWEVTEQGNARLAARFHAGAVEPRILDEWPADFELTALYELGPTSLTLSLTVRNPDTRPLPWGLGLHPYFRLPLGSRGTAACCRLTVPAEKRWELVNVLPTGRTMAVEGHFDLRAGRPLADATYDDVYGGLCATEGKCTCAIDDPANGRRITIAFGNEYHAAVVYTPPHRGAVCIEPYTCVPDPFWLTAQGHDAGLRTLPPGENFTTTVEFAVAQAL